MKQIPLLLIPIFMLVLLNSTLRDGVAYGEIERLRHEVKYLNYDINYLKQVLKNNGVLDTIFELGTDSASILWKQYANEYWYIHTGMYNDIGEKIYKHSDEVKDMLQQQRSQ
jgi:hypothetical protein